MDIQTCPIELESFGYSTETLQFNWQEKNAIQLNPYIVLPQFEIKGFKLQDCTKNYATGKCKLSFSQTPFYQTLGILRVLTECMKTKNSLDSKLKIDCIRSTRILSISEVIGAFRKSKNGQFCFLLPLSDTCILGQFIMKRQIGYYLAQMYFPTMLVVFFSWVSFWIDRGAAPARTSLGVTTVLTITKQAGSAAAETPKLAYIKGIDYWMSTCMLFVFAALLEYAVVQVGY